MATGASAVGAALGGALIEGPAGVSGSLLLAVAGAALAVLVTLVPGRRPARERVSEPVAA
jgi:predicted MFS family arabinose efflux permease